MRAVWPLLLGKDAKPHDLPFPEVQVFEGGFEFEAELHTGVQLNFFLKTANRVLLRMASFKAKDLPKFYQKFKSLPWIDFLPDGHVEWEVAAQKSRLNNEKRLQESAEQALSEIFKGQRGAQSCGTIYVRMDDDLCTISLDSTGEHLHKRGWSILKGEAPLRETLAAIMLKDLMDGATAADLAQVTLLDPMMGSGTFLTEARALWFGQFARPYAFQKWKRAPKLFLSPSFALNYKALPTMSFAALVGNDLNPDMVTVAEKNFSEVERQIQTVQRAAFVKTPHSFTQGDGLASKVPQAERLWMVVNPPYGERLATAGEGGPVKLAQGLCRHYSPERLGILYPEKERVMKAPPGYKVLKEVKINNGGIRCLFTLLTRL